MTVEIIIIVCLILVGVALLLAEIFLLPGITVAGIAGGVMMVGSIVYAFYYVGPTTGYITIAANIVIGVGAFIFVIKSNALDHIALKTDIESVVEQPEIQKLSVGQKGIALSRLNPIGKVEFNDESTVEAKSVTGEFIDAGEWVEIVHIDKSSVLVKISATDQV
ncbi:NfeD family protein [Dysgonomonas macrotermitis]|uniref:NfeD-like C-terminal, partner-binding n=1 Tax=Dysgonomonas macrotermitis TaxID=1346286 RepID=A0A1M5DBF6_9BACT|nr:NfeD family protein [Dysgonomonas macrotermitis]SHF64261.1 NfeD-like C-terminal, partner-binding [Dysgonomonas macrotermitis]